MAKTPQTKTCILTYDGDFFDFRSPKTHDFNIDTIAHALSQLCRYTGHTKKFYSVAEHSVLVSKLVPTKLALEGLLHDASEAYCGDVSSPLKRLIPSYRTIEDGVQEAIAIFFGLKYPFPHEVHEADAIMYKTERLSISATGVDNLWLKDFEPREDIVIEAWNPKRAKAEFLDRYKELTGDASGYQQLRRKAA